MLIGHWRRPGLPLRAAAGPGRLRGDRDRETLVNTRDTVFGTHKQVDGREPSFEHPQSGVGCVAGERRARDGARGSRRFSLHRIERASSASQLNTQTSSR
jgi:hypothetical protein